jgi:hypothetical protein
MSETTPGAAAETAGTGGQRSRWTFGRVLLVVLGSIAVLVGVGLLFGGCAALVIDRTQRDDDGFVMSPAEDFSTGAYAIVSETAEVHVEGPDWLVREGLGTVRIRSESVRPVFVGIGPAADVAAYLRDVAHAVVTSLDDDDLRPRPGGAPGSPAAEQGFWAASSSGVGEQVLDWDVEDGDWTVVAMNADGSRGVTLEASIGAELGILPWVAGVLLVLCALFLAAGIGMIVAGVRRPSS